MTGQKTGSGSGSGSGTGGLRRRGTSWFHQFPAPLRELALLRLIGSLGAGGVLYLTPMVFHQAALGASGVTQGVALAALAGTAGRLLCGLLLDRGLNCGVPVLLALLLSLLGDSVLLGAHDFAAYLLGQALLGSSMGFYWPAIELAVALSCPPVPSARGFALARTADAAGIVAGALLGSLLAWASHLRAVYLVDITCLGVMALLLLRHPLPDPRPRLRSGPSGAWREWLPPLLPLLGVAIVATAMPALMQSALPLELVRGGWRRPPLPEAVGALLIGLQLALLLLLQWPVGQSLARRPVGHGLGLSLLCFCGGSLLLAASAFSPAGLWWVLVAQLPLALGQAAFLPIATEAVVEVTPLEHQGLAMALFSQCFAISALVAPLLAGAVLERQGHGTALWLGMALCCVLSLELVRRLRSRAAAVLV